MKYMGKRLREECAADPFYTTCARNKALHDHECEGDALTGRLIEWEHTMIYGDNKIQEKWAIIPSCWWAHRGPGLVKEINVWIALNRASDEELLKYSKAEDLIRKRAYLNSVYGEYRERKIKSPLEFQEPKKWAGIIGINY